MKKLFLTMCLLISLIGYLAHLAKAADRDRLNPNEQLFVGEALVSSNGRFSLFMQSDGNLVLYQNGYGATWASNTVGSGASRLIMQADGNLVIYRADNTPVWASYTQGNGPSTFYVQEDGNLVIYNEAGSATWATYTGIAQQTISDPRHLEDRIDRCGEQDFKIVDSSNNQTYVAPFTTSRLVIVNSKNVIWFCGGYQGVTRCPNETNAVTVERGQGRLLLTHCYSVVPEVVEAAQKFGYYRLGAIGERPLLVILMDTIADGSLAKSPTEYDQLIFGPTFPNVRDYFSAISYGKFSWSRAGLVGPYNYPNPTNSEDLEKKRNAAALIYAGKTESISIILIEIPTQLLITENWVCYS